MKVTLPILVLLVVQITLPRAARSAELGEELFKLKGNEATRHDWFGVSTAISGDKAIVGASSLTIADRPRAGSAYIFDVNSGAQLKRLTPSDGKTLDMFGYSVAIDGNMGLIGAIGYRSLNESQVGLNAAYLFDIDNGTQLAKLNAEDGEPGNEFGYSVALESNLALIGSPLDDHVGENFGSAYVFDVSTGAQLAKLTVDDAFANSFFGAAVALDGNLALIGAPGNTGTSQPDGAAYLFDVSTGEQLLKLTADDEVGRIGFGTSVALDGNTAVIGTYHAGAATSPVPLAYVFDAMTGQQRLSFTTDAVNNRSSVAIDGNSILLSGSAGAPAYLYDASTGEQLAELVGSNSNYSFGRSVALSDGVAIISNCGCDGTVAGWAYLFSASRNALGDFDGDDQLSISDLDALSQHVATGDNDTSFDLNKDQVVDVSDLRVWVHDLKQTWFGDANLDGQFSSADLVAVFGAGQYEDDLLGNSKWSTGDWTGDGEFSTSDLVAAFQDGGYEQGQRAAIQAVPEPTSLTIMMLCMATFIRNRKERGA